MSKSDEPWRDLPREVADLLRPELRKISREIVAAIAREVPEYARPLDGAFGDAIRAGVDQSLQRFVGLIGEADVGEDDGREVYIALGRGELRAGRTLDALQSAYRVGARVAWRRFARASHAARLDQEIVAQLAEAVFAYIDELSAESVDGYAQAQSELAGERQQRHAELVAALLGRAPAVDTVGLATLVDWQLPRTAAAVACPLGRLPRLSGRLGATVLAAPFDGLGCVIVPDAEGPGQRERVVLASAGRSAALGPDLPLGALGVSWELARGALELTDGDGFAVADDHLGELLVHRAAPVADRIWYRRLAGLTDLTPTARERMTETALAYVQYLGNAAAMARVLHVHPQTARYRIARLRELLGDQLDDPDARFELEAALRLRRRGRARAEVTMGNR